MKTCPKCGELNGNDSNACFKCGAYLGDAIAQAAGANEVPTPEPRKKAPKAWLIAGAAGLLVFIVAAASVSNSNNKYESLQDDYTDLKSDYSSLEADYTSLQTEYADYKETMKPYEDMTKAEAEAKTAEANRKKKEEEDALKAQQEAEAQAQAQAEAEAAAAKAAEEAKGYETGITYDQLARNPDDYMGKKVKFYGKVVQVIEDDTTIQIRLAVDDNYDTILLGEYSSSIVSSRVLEDDYITIYGMSVGTISYKSTLGGTITIPGVYIDRIDQ